MPSAPKIAEATTWLSKLSQRFTAHMNTLLDPYGLTQSQFSILHHIAHAQSTRIADIASAVEAGQPAVTKAVAKFQDVGLINVIDSKTDKRSKIITPTPALAPFLESIFEDIGPDLFKTFNAIDAGELPTFTKNLRQLCLWLDAEKS